MRARAQRMCAHTHAHTRAHETFLFGGEDISEVDWDIEKDVKSLGVYLDPNLDMNKYISYIRQFCIGQLSSWKRIAVLLDTDTTETLLSTLSP